MVLRHLLSILLLPFMAVVVVPALLLREGAQGLPLPGALLMLAGIALFAWCVALFARVGQGTLAPWDPARKLVAAGPYRHVRNPMISGVLMMLIGQALYFGSSRLGLWAGIFFLVNYAYFILSEEPGLEKRFGEKYRVYKANVPRWVPRVRPWMQ